ncbi:hypothetical protein SAMN05428642_1011027 [Flaviramulus basaltis]|uniref:Uncharacterized protein n=1 Tax=Flaviramulus basaltis TaxID=369401 RepID=A0A1K2IEA0_9FLAO|nr:hypothetical protein [Flaviramulus basaltis]SFZ90594.1 hypothetical protein SAMN05428642_1011027 [Flaviramulus basaltis]
MNLKVLTVFSLILLFVSCKKTQDTEASETIEKQQSQDLTQQEISKLKYIEYALDSKTEDVIIDWKEYYQFQDIITNIKQGDLSFFYNNDEEVKLLVKNLKANIPAQVNSASISARLLVLETKLLKLESLSNLSTTSKEELLNTIKEFFVAFSNINFQMNKKIEFDNRDIEKP